VKNVIGVVTRSFQAGVGDNEKPFNTEEFERRVRLPIQRLLHCECVVLVIVMVNTEPGNPLAEIISEEGGLSPTERALRDSFPNEISSKRLIVRPCSDWGKNPGSAVALNQGDDVARECGMATVLHWSPEIQLTDYHLHQLMMHAEQHQLMVTGLLRQRWWERAQWNVAQNTAALWNLHLLKQVGGFDPRCNGTGETINVPEYGDVPLAGMEDFHAMLRIMKLSPVDNFRWGMAGRSEPLIWDVNFPAGSSREKNHLIKVARQYAVMRQWAEEIYPELPFEVVMDRLFTCYHQD